MTDDPVKRLLRSNRSSFGSGTAQSGFAPARPVGSLTANFQGYFSSYRPAVSSSQRPTSVSPDNVLALMGRGNVRSLSVLDGTGNVLQRDPVVTSAEPFQVETPNSGPFIPPTPTKKFGLEALVDEVTEVLPGFVKEPIVQEATALTLAILGNGTRYLAGPFLFNSKNLLPVGLRVNDQLGVYGRQRRVEYIPEESRLSAFVRLDEHMQETGYTPENATDTGMVKPREAVASLYMQQGLGFVGDTSGLGLRLSVGQALGHPDAHPYAGQFFNTQVRTPDGKTLGGQTDYRLYNVDHLDANIFVFPPRAENGLQTAGTTIKTGFGYYYQNLPENMPSDGSGRQPAPGFRWDIIDVSQTTPLGGG